MVEVENTGHILDAYSIEVSGLEPSWTFLSEQAFSVFPGARATATLSFHPPNNSGAVAGSYPFSLVVKSQYFPSQSVSVEGCLEVQPVYSFLQDLHPSRVRGPTGRFTNTISNTGNAEITFDLQGSTPEDLCEFEVEPNPATLSPSETLEVDILAKPARRPWFGKHKTFSITFTSTPDQIPQVTTFAATLEAQPRLRPWDLAVAALVLLLLLVLAYSGYWAAFEREDLTYFRQETWPVQLDTFSADQGVVFPILFHLLPNPGVEEVNPLPLHLRVEVEWPDTGDVPLSLALILRDPAGNCWEHRRLARTAGPTQFPLFSGGTPCGSIEFNRLLLDHSSRPVKPARYASLDVVAPEVAAGPGHVLIEPVDQYCVRRDGTVIFDGKNPRLAADQGRPSDEEIDYWTLYLINNNDHQEYEEPPQVLVRLKASVLDKDSTERDRNYGLSVIAVPHSGPPIPASDETTCKIAWDDNVRLGSNGKLIEGSIYVKRLEFCDRSDPACQPEEQDRAFVAGRQSQLHVFSGHADPCAGIGELRSGAGAEDASGPAVICGDILWDSGQDNTGTSAMVILRDHAGNCWTSLESKTVAEEDQPTPFAFEMAAALPCDEILRDEILWYLVNWFPTDFEKPQVAAYDAPVEPLVRLCKSGGTEEESSLLFDTATVIPEVHPATYSRAPGGWHLFVINGSIYATEVSEDHEFAPRVSLSVKGDDRWRITIQDPEPSRTETTSPVIQCPFSAG